MSPEELLDKVVVSPAGEGTTEKFPVGPQKRKTDNTHEEPCLYSLHRQVVPQFPTQPPVGLNSLGEEENLHLCPHSPQRELEDLKLVAGHPSFIAIARVAPKTVTQTLHSRNCVQTLFPMSVLIQKLLEG